MLINQTLQKLHSMRLTGLAEALTQQLEDPDSSVLSFEERIGRGLGSRVSFQLADHDLFEAPVVQMSANPFQLSIRIHVGG